MNESELISLQNANIYQLDNLLKNNKVSLNDLSDQLPGWIHLNRLDDLSLAWVSGSMENDLEKKSHELANSGAEFLFQIIHPSITNQVIPSILNYNSKQDISHTLGFIQKIRKNLHEPYLPYYTVIKLTKKLDYLICQSLPLNNIEQLVLETASHLGYNNYHKKYLRQFQSLTKREKEILRLAAFGESSKTISEQLHLSLHTVKTHRKNILNKLQTKRYYDLIKICEAFGLL